MRNKKAFLLGEYTLKIIIGVLCLLLLVYLLYSLYSNSQDERDLKMAEASLNEVVEGMNEAKETGIIQEALILNPIKKTLVGKAILKQYDWWIIAWPYKNEKEKPGQCQEDCICICAIPENYKSITSIFTIRKESLDQCNLRGVCKDFNENIKTTSNGLLWDWNKPIIIENPPVELEIEYNDKEGFEIKEK